MSADPVQGSAAGFAPALPRVEYRVMCIPAATRRPAIWCRSTKEFLSRDAEQARKEKAEGHYIDVWVESRTVTDWSRVDA